MLLREVWLFTKLSRMQTDMPTLGNSKRIFHRTEVSLEGCLCKTWRASFPGSSTVSPLGVGPPPKQSTGSQSSLLESLTQQARAEIRYFSLRTNLDYTFLLILSLER
jgi:hypothetical protein